MDALEFGQKLIELDGPEDIFKYLGLIVVAASIIIPLTKTKKDDEILNFAAQYFELVLKILNRFAVTNRRNPKDEL